MKKLLLALLFIAGLSSTAVNAQMTDGCLAPDFTGTDLDGNSWNLYSILDQGKTVIIDVSATWCGPCWSYHTGHALRDFYNAYGPSGTDQAMVFMVEGDATTSLADLQGNTGATQGDWITGTPYPIIDNAQIGDALEISYFPTIYMICPDRTIREVGQQSVATLYTRMGDCSVASSPADAGVAKSSGCLNDPSQLASCTDVTINYRLTNYGTSPLTSATVELSGTGVVSQTYNWTGSLNTYESTVLTFNNVAGSGPGNYQAYVTTSNPNGTTDPVAANDAEMTQFIIYPTVGGAAVNESFAPVSFPPAGWYVLDNDNDNQKWIRSTAGYNGTGSAKIPFYNSPDGSIDILQLAAMDLTGMTDAVLTFDLAHARYSNSYTDNIKIKVSTNCGASWNLIYNKSGAALATTANQSSAFTPSDPAQWRNESVSLTNYVGNPNVFIRFEGMSGYGNNAYIDNVAVTMSTGMKDITEVSSISLYPNPASEFSNLNITLNGKDDVNVQVFNKLGSLVYEMKETGLSAGLHTLTIPTADLADGLYTVNVKTSEGTSVQKLVIR